MIIKILLIITTAKSVQKCGSFIKCAAKDRNATRQTTNGIIKRKAKPSLRLLCGDVVIGKL